MRASRTLLILLLACSETTPLNDAVFVDSAIDEGVFVDSTIRGTLDTPIQEPSCQPSGAELCNHFDDDCDGLVDEGFEVDQPCLVEGQPCAGLTECSKEGGLICNPLPVLEDMDTECDGVDDDCDGLIDEDPPCNGCEVGTWIPSGFVCIPSKEFTRGADRQSDPDALVGEGPPHHVRVDSFLISETETTVEEWVQYGGEPFQAAECENQDCPIVGVSWFEVIDYANRRSISEGLTPCFDLQDCNEAGNSGCLVERGCEGEFVCDVVRDAHNDCTGYRLPTEAEWELAARGKKTSPRWFDGPIGGEVCEPEHNTPLPVATVEANPYGVYDMLGNVAEWTADRYVALYPEVEGVLVNPRVTFPAPLIFPDNRATVRGSSAYHRHDYCRVTVRQGKSVNLKVDWIGFRLVRVVIAKD